MIYIYIATSRYWIIAFSLTCAQIGSLFVIVVFPFYNIRVINHIICWSNWKLWIAPAFDIVLCASALAVLVMARRSIALTSLRQRVLLMAWLAHVIGVWVLLLWN